MEERFEQLCKIYPQLDRTIDEEEELTLGDVVFGFIRRELKIQSEEH